MRPPLPPTPWVSTGTCITPTPGRLPGEPLGCGCPLPPPHVAQSCFLFARTCREGLRATVESVYPSISPNNSKRQLSLGEHLLCARLCGVPGIFSRNHE